jgi:hypothetical protein
MKYLILLLLVGCCTEPTPVESKFKFGDLVRVSGFYSGCKGRVVAESSDAKYYKIELDCDHYPNFESWYKVGDIVVR